MSIRYLETLRGLQEGEDSCLWVDLNNCSIQDKKMMQVSGRERCNVLENVHGEGLWRPRTDCDACFRDGSCAKHSGRTITSYL